MKFVVDFSQDLRQPDLLLDSEEARGFQNLYQLVQEEDKIFRAPMLTSEIFRGESGDSPYGDCPLWNLLTSEIFRSGNGPGEDTWEHPPC